MQERLQLLTMLHISPTDFDAVKALVLQEKVEMVVVGPEDPLVKGIFDFFKNDERFKRYSSYWTIKIRSNS